MGLSKELSCETGSFSHYPNTHRFLQPEVLRLYFPTMKPWVFQSVSLPSCSSWFICTQLWGHWLHQQPHTLVLQPPLCHESSPPWLRISAPPIGLDECFFFNSLVVGLPYSSIFWKFWLVVFLNLLLSFFGLCEEAQCVYLPHHLGRKS